MSTLKRDRIIIAICVMIMLGIVLAVIRQVFGGLWWVAAGSIAAGVIGLVCIVGSQYEERQP